MNMLRELNRILEIKVSAIINIFIKRYIMSID